MDDLVCVGKVARGVAHGQAGSRAIEMAKERIDFQLAMKLVEVLKSGGPLLLELQSSTRDDWETRCLVLESRLRIGSVRKFCRHLALEECDVKTPSRWDRVSDTIFRVWRWIAHVSRPIEYDGPYA